MQPLDTYAGPSAAAPPEKREHYAEAHLALVSEFMNAWYIGGDTMIQTPGFADSISGTPELPIGDVVREDMDAADLAEMMAHVNSAAMGRFDADAAMKLIAKLAKGYADYHADDLAKTMGGEQ